MITVEELFTKISARQFQPADAGEFIKTSYYFAQTHPDVHIVLSVSRPADFHFQHVPKYERRSLHSMFQSMEDAKAGIAGSLNCRAGEAAMRFLSVSSVRKIVLFSRSGAHQASDMTLRTAIGHAGSRTGTMYGDHKTKLIVVVLGIYNGSVVLTTAYPSHMLADNKPEPPEGSDLLEYDKTQYFTYPSN